eukprot:20403-Pelagococcus_subviridis.AAC.1
MNITADDSLVHHSLAMSFALACDVGYTSMSHTCTRPGRVSAYTMLSAMSSASSGPPYFMPLYTPSAFAASPLNRTAENSVFTNPGATVVILHGVSWRSLRHAYVNAFTAALVAQYTLPPPYHCAFHTKRCRGGVER